MVVFLSTSYLEALRTQLLEGGYSEETPAAIVYKATWPDEKVVHGTVGILPEMAAKNGITKTALILIGNFLGKAYERSKLYAPDFSTDTVLPKRRVLPMRIECVAFTSNGVQLGLRLISFLQQEGNLCRLSAPLKYVKKDVDPLDSLAEWTASAFEKKRMRSSLLGPVV